jgi:hypothetical protein
MDKCNKSLAKALKSVLHFNLLHYTTKEPMKFLIDLFRTPTAAEIAARELHEAKRDLLNAQSGYEYAKRMAEYNTDRVRRLTLYLADAK